MEADKARVTREVNIHNKHSLSCHESPLPMEQISMSSDHSQIGPEDSLFRFDSSSGL